MTDKQIKETKNGFYCIEPCCEIKELKEKLISKEQECKALREEKAYTDMACEQFEKQLKAKEQECDELKKANKHIENNRNQKADKLMRIETLITACSTGYTDEFIQELLVILHEPEPSSFENKYKTTLTEIKEIVEDAKTKVFVDMEEFWKQILQKISEVENEHIN